MYNFLFLPLLLLDSRVDWGYHPRACPREGRLIFAYFKVSQIFLFRALTSVAHIKGAQTEMTSYITPPPSKAQAVLRNTILLPFENSSYFLLPVPTRILPFSLLAVPSRPISPPPPNSHSCKLMFLKTYTSVVTITWTACYDALSSQVY